MIEFLSSPARVIGSPSISSLSTEPILFTQVPALDTVHDELAFFVDGVPRALVVRRSSVRSVARDDDEIDSQFDDNTLTSGVSVTWEIVGSRMARRQMSKRENIEEIGRSAANAVIVRLNAATTARLVGASISLRSAVRARGLSPAPDRP